MALYLQPLVRVPIEVTSTDESIQYFIFLRIFLVLRDKIIKCTLLFEISTNEMFSRLKEHAVKIEQDLEYLETALDLKLKKIFSVVKHEVSESSLKFFDDLIVELQTINSDVETAIVAVKKSNEDFKTEGSQTVEIIDIISQDSETVQRHLEEYGYVRNNTMNNSDDTNDFLRYESMVKRDV